MQIQVLNKDGVDTGRKVDLLDDIYAVKPNDHAIYLEVKRHLAAKRQGTHKSKERASIAGSTRKIKKQKGTGTARAGSIKSPLFRGGGRIFGPRPRDYSFKLNKNLRRLARKSALSVKASNSDIVVVEDFTLDTVKTKSYLQIMSALGLSNKTSLLVLPKADKNIYLSSRNLPDCKTVFFSELSTYEILKTNKIVILESSVKGIESNFTIDK
jgi:large subunit ribosomal protein L4